MQSEKFHSEGGFAQLLKFSMELKHALQGGRRPSADDGLRNATRMGNAYCPFLSICAGSARESFLAKISKHANMSLFDSDV